MNLVAFAALVVLLNLISLIQMHGRLREKTLIVRKSTYHYVHDAFRYNNYSTNRFVSNDTGFIPIHYELRQNMLWKNHSLCKNDSFLLMMIFTYRTDKRRRNLIRQYIKQDMIVNGKRVNYVFIVAAEKEDMKGEDEFADNDDIMVSLHRDTRANWTITILDSFLWVRDYCQSVKYVAKVDGDTWVNVWNLVHYLEKVPREKFYGGKVIHCKLNKGQRYKALLFYPRDYPERYVTFCLGGCSLFSMDVVPYINIGASYLDVLFPAVEDIVLGEILHRAGINPYTVASSPYILYSEVFEWKQGIPNNTIAVHNIKDLALLTEVYKNHSVIQFSRG